MENKICDFCLEEGKGLFRQPKRIDEKHFVCNSCAKTIESYDLPLEYDLFQILVTADKEMREMIMNTWIERNNIDDMLQRYYPPCSIPLHRKEECINIVKSSIRVDESKIPSEPTVTSVAQITHKQIINLPNDPNGIEVEGLLVETNAALYFLAKNFINTHRLSTIATDCLDEEEIHVMDQGKSFSYSVDHADLFFMRYTLYHLLTIAKEKKKENLIYLTSDNTMTLTPGIYRVPKNIKSGTYYITPVEDAHLSIRDAAGRVINGGKGKIRIDEGSILEVTGQYEFRIHDRLYEEEDDLK